MTEISYLYSGRTTCSLQAPYTPLSLVDRLENFQLHSGIEAKSTSFFCCCMQLSCAQFWKTFAVSRLLREVRSRFATVSAAVQTKHHRGISNFHASWFVRSACKKKLVVQYSGLACNPKVPDFGYLLLPSQQIKLPLKVEYFRLWLMTK